MNISFLVEKVPSLECFPDLSCGQIRLKSTRKSWSNTSLLKTFNFYISRLYQIFTFCQIGSWLTPNDAINVILEQDLNSSFCSFSRTSVSDNIFLESVSKIEYLDFETSWHQIHAVNVPSFKKLVNGNVWPRVHTFLATSLASPADYTYNEFQRRFYFYDRDF